MRVAVMIAILMGVSMSARAQDRLYVYEIKSKTHITPYPIQGQAPVQTLRPSKRRRAHLKPIAYLELVSRWARHYKLPPALVLAVIEAESGFNPRAISRVGAQGLMQLMPRTAAAYGVTRLHDPSQNIQAGCAHLAWLKRRYKGDINRMLSAYNAGGASVRRRGGIPYRKTRRYVAKIVRSWRKYEQRLNVSSGIVDHKDRSRRGQILPRSSARGGKFK